MEWLKHQIGKKHVEETARLNRVGLWSDPEPVPPWEDRKKGNKSISFSTIKENNSKSKTLLTDNVRYNTKTLKYHCISCKHATNCTSNCEDINISEAAEKGISCKACGGSCR